MLKYKTFCTYLVCIRCKLTKRTGFVRILVFVGGNVECGVRSSYIIRVVALWNANILIKMFSIKNTNTRMYCVKYYERNILKHPHEILIILRLVFFLWFVQIKFFHHTSTHAQKRSPKISLSKLYKLFMFFQYNNLNLFMAGYIFQYFSSYLLMLYIYHVLARTIYYPSFALMLRRNHHS